MLMTSYYTIGVIISYTIYTTVTICTTILAILTGPIAYLPFTYTVLDDLMDVLDRKKAKKAKKRTVVGRARNSIGHMMNPKGIYTLYHTITHYNTL